MELKPKKVELPSHDSKWHRDNRRLMSVDSTQAVLNPVHAYEKNTVQKSLPVQIAQKDRTKKIHVVLGSPITTDADMLVLNVFLSLLLIAFAYPILGVTMLFFGLLMEYANVFFVIAYVIVALWLLFQYARVLFKCLAKCCRLGSRVFAKLMSDYGNDLANLSNKGMTDRQNMRDTTPSDGWQNYLSKLSPEEATKHKKNLLTLRNVAILILGFRCVTLFFEGDFSLGLVSAVIIVLIWKKSKSVFMDLEKKPIKNKG